MIQVSTIQMRRGTAALWTSRNPVLASGEFGYETDTGKLKIGDGTSAWVALGYILSAFFTIGDLTGTANQVTVTDGTGAVIGSGTQLSLPQDIHNAATPTFAGLITSGVAALDTVAEAWVGPSSVAGIYFKGGNVGLGTTDPTSPLALAATSTATADYPIIFSIWVVVDPAGASTAEYTANYSGIGGAAANAEDLSAARMIGVYANVYNEATGTLGKAEGVFSAVSKASTGPITSIYAFRGLIENAVAAGAITNAYGLYIEPFLRTGTITNSWGIYIADTIAKNYFGGSVGIGTTSFGTSAVKVLSIGLGTAPTTSPADVAQVYVADRGGVAGKSSLYLRNEDDTTGYYVGPLYGEMYDYENATAVAIDQTNVYHAIHTIDSAGLYKGWTFKAGSTGPIASFATHSAGAATLCTDVGHGLVSNEIITIANSTNYNGAHIVTRIDNDTFTIPVAYVAEAGGPNWIRGSSLRADTGSAGVYKLTWGTTMFPAGANDNFKVEPNLNTTDLDNMAASMRLTVASDRRNMGGSGLVAVADGDYIWFSVRNEDAADDITFRHFNCSVVKL